MKTTLKKAQELLESIEPKDNAQKLEKATGLALVSLATQLGRVASALETRAKQPK